LLTGTQKNHHARVHVHGLVASMKWEFVKERSHWPHFRLWIGRHMVKLTVPINLLTWARTSRYWCEPDFLEKTESEHPSNRATPCRSQ